ncbi:MAG: type II toxin-antitoxin system Phd/YefM family antitoxin [Bryobacterales bacterium]|nr:type II toxin-antitoxin system Phd/YefM family antitoxin [Bryobacterales bacterium]
MIKVNVAEAKVRLSSCLDRAQQGETVIICRRNVPIAELRPIPQSPDKQRPTGIDRGMKVPDSFFEPLPDDVIEAFEGTSETE